MAYFYRFVLLLLFSSFSSLSSAYVLNIDPRVPLYPQIYQNCKGPNYDYGDLKSGLLTSTKRFWVSFKSGFNASGNCMEAFGVTCPIGTDTVELSNTGMAICRVTGCPENSSKQDGYCVCNSGYIEQGNSCVVKPPDDCEGLEQTCQTSKGQTAYFEMQSAPGAGFSATKACLPNPKYPKCSKGCTIESSIYVGYASNVDGKYYYGGEGKITGTVCFGSNGANGEEEVIEAEAPSTKCKPGEAEGWVSDKLVCIPPKSKESTLEYKTSDNGDGTNTETISTVKCENGVCTIKTEVSIKDGSLEPRGTTTTETKISEAEFCQKNPSNIVCRTPGSGTGTGTGTGTGSGSGSGTGDGSGSGTGTGSGDGSGSGTGEGEGEGKGSFGGSCTSGFTCEGDAAQCAIAKEQHRINCEQLREVDGSAIGGSGESADDLKAAADLITVERLDDTGLGWSRSCPADEEISLGFASGSLTIPFSKLCGILGSMASILLAITALGLLYWLVGGGGKKE